MKVNASTHWQTQHDVILLARFSREGRILIFNISVFFEDRKTTKVDSFSRAIYFIYIHSYMLTIKNAGVSHCVLPTFAGQFSTCI